MKTVDLEFMDASVQFIEQAQQEGKPYFVWLNPSRTHLFTHLTDEHRYLALDATTGMDLYGSGMIEHDMQMGDYLSKLQETGALDNTIIVYSTVTDAPAMTRRPSTW